jgi:hypothetical protein
MMFHREAVRLLRDGWSSTKALAEELYAILQKQIPLFHEAPVTITTEGDEAPLVLRNFGEDGPIMVVKGPGNTDVGGLYIRDGKLKVLQGKNGVDGEDAPGTGGGGVPGKVLSGSGESYSVALYGNGPASAPTSNASVIIPGVAAGESIPEGTWVTVTELSDTLKVATAPLWM